MLANKMYKYVGTKAERWRHKQFQLVRNTEENKGKNNFITKWEREQIIDDTEKAEIFTAFQFLYSLPKH